jgi:flagellar basal body-associated protein FliL
MRRETEQSAERGRRAARRKKRLVRKLVIVAIVGLFALGGLAFAFWTGGGSGSGSGTTGSPSALTVNQTSTNSGLYPGGSSALSGNFTNPNGGKVYIAAVTASITTFSVQADNTKPACTQADFSISGTATVGAEINSGSGVGSWSGLTLNMTDAGTNQDNCKNITVPITAT